MLRPMRAVLVVVCIGAVAAIAWLLFEARGLRSATASPPIAVAPLPVRSPPAPPARAAPPTPPSPAPAAATAPNVATARARVESVLSAVARVCPLPRDADRNQRLVVRITASGDRVQSLEHVGGALPAAVTACIDRHLRAARWPPVATPLTFDLAVRAGELKP